MNDGHEYVRRAQHPARSIWPFPGAPGGRALRDTYGRDYLLAIATKGGRTTLERYGRAYMRELASRRGKAKRRKQDTQPRNVMHWDGTPERHVPYRPPRSRRALIIRFFLAVDGRAKVLPLDIDAGGLPAIQFLIAEARRRDLWAFGQYSPRPGLPDTAQHGYVWLPFDTITDRGRLQALGTELIAASRRPEWKIEARAIHAVTRLPLARHTHTARFGELIIGDQIIEIASDPAGALAELHYAYRENPSARLPELPLASQSVPRPATRRDDEGITITHYNQAHDIENLIRNYGGRAARRRGLYFCPFHSDEHASLSVYTRHGQQYCRCFSAHSHCPLARNRMNDAFNVYCIGEGIDAKAALRRLNKR